MLFYYLEDEMFLSTIRTLAADDRVFVAADALLFAEFDAGFVTTSFNRITIDGAVFTRQETIFGDFGSNANVVTIWRTGSVRSDITAAIDVSGDDNVLRNAGIVEGSDGVRVRGARAQIDNSGDIFGFEVAVDLGFANFASGIALYNSGSIVAVHGAVRLDDRGIATVVNSGTIRALGLGATGLAIEATSGTLNLINSGRIEAPSIAAPAARYCTTGSATIN